MLDWRPPAAAKISHAEVNGEPIAAPRIVREHFVIPERLVCRGENAVHLRFEVPIAAAGTAITRFRDHEDGAQYVYSLFVPADASTVFPCFDQPDLKARFALALDVPAGWEAVSNAPVVARRDRPIRFRETEPLSTYVFAFAAGPFEIIDERDVADAVDAPPARLFVRRSRIEPARAEAREIFRLHRLCVRYFADYFGMPFPFAKHDLVVVPEFPYGGMEHAGATFLREDAMLFPSTPSASDLLRRAQLIFHETAHQWFGDLVTMRWFDDLWLKEGFANFMAAKAAAALLAEHSAWNAFHRLKAGACRTDMTRGTTPLWQRLPNLSAAKSAYGNIVYGKAPAVLRQAEFYLGAEVFQRAVRGFVRAHAYRAADWRDLVRALESASGRKLDRWASAWVMRRGLPEVRVRWRSDRAGRIARFVLSQSAVLGGQGVWPLRTEVMIADADGVRTLPVTLDRARTVVPALVGASAPRYVYANHGDHAYGRFPLDDRSRAAVRGEIRSVDDPLLRALLLDALWEEVRDAQLAPLDYIDLALDQLPRETDEITVSSLLDGAQTAFRRYLSDAQRAAVAARIEACLREGMLHAPELGARIAHFRAYTAAAVTAEARADLHLLIAGKLDVPGMALASRERFRIVERLLALGDPGADRLLAAQAAADASDDGHRYAYAAGAARADPAAKQRYFAAYVRDTRLAEGWITESLVAFNTVEHAALTLPYLRRALVALSRLQRERKIFFVNHWLTAFLDGQTTAAALATVKSFLRGAKLAPDLRRKVLEAMDGLARTVRIRARYGA